MLCLTSPTMKRFPSGSGRETSLKIASWTGFISWYSSTSTSANLLLYSRAASDGSGKAEGSPGLLKICRA